MFLESGKKMTTIFLYKNLIDDLNLFVSDKNLVKNGENNIKDQLKLFLSNKKGISHLFAVMKAHFAFYFEIPKLIAKRRKISQQASLVGKIKHSILVKNKLKSINKFSDL